MFLDFFKISNIFHNGKDMSRWVLTVSLLCKDLILQIALPVQCSSFYDAIHKGQEACILITRESASVEEKKLLKNVQRLHNATFTKVTVCGLFCMDVMLSVRFVELLTQYIIVLLQLILL